MGSGAEAVKKMALANWSAVSDRVFVGQKFELAAHYMIREFSLNGQFEGTLELIEGPRTREHPGDNHGWVREDDVIVLARAYPLTMRIALDNGHEAIVRTSFPFKNATFPWSPGAGELRIIASFKSATLDEKKVCRLTALEAAEDADCKIRLGDFSKPRWMN